MPDWDSQANDLFLDALERPSGAERDDFLRTACDGDSQLLRRVAALLAARKDAGDFLSAGGMKLAAGHALGDAPEQPGDMLGPYKLLQEIGEGGMGVVYMAEQREPIRRTVAVKIIKPGMDSRQVIARFEAERQALALMNHPHIAQVYDAGTTAAGRPYFVMELVKGLPITRYCDQQRLSPEARLRLFVTACQGVQHAHQKGVIHRDLKPSNVLIAPYDGVPAAKIIDFGVAKATGPKLTDRTMFTEFGAVVGTLEYMSPEQAELNQLDVDTRSDVYSLGVLLYELITGTTPLDAQRLRAAPFDEMRRMLREETPERPSTRLGSSAQLPALAVQRGLEPGKLIERVRGDLDWIVMKALEKDRDRRYETADALARDIERYLAQEPVEARSPSAAYRFQMFARRNRGPVAAAAIVALALVAGVTASTLLAFRAMRAEQAALASAAEARTAAEAERHAREAEAAERTKAEHRLDYLTFVLGAVLPELGEGNLLDLVNRAGEGFENLDLTPSNANARVLLHVGRSFFITGRFDAAERHLRKALELAGDPLEITDIKLHLGQSLLRLGRADEGNQLLRGLLAQKIERLTTDDARQLQAAWPGLADAATTDRAGRATSGLEFDGKDDFVLVPSLHFDGTPPWTLEAIINPVEIDQHPSRTELNWTSLISTTEGGGIGLETARGAWAIGLYAPMAPSTHWDDNYATAVAAEAPRFGQWVHLAGTWDGAELRLYVDGRLQGSRANVVRISSNVGGAFILGGDPCHIYHEKFAEGLFHGTYRAVRISHGLEYRESFDPPQRLKATPETLALYDFTSDTEPYAVDRSGRGNHGIIVGGQFVPDE